MSGKSAKTEKMKQIKEEIVALTSLPLYEYRTVHNYFPVIGEGSHSAKVMFIGEAPGKNEAETGRPFCGAAGRVLDELLASVGLQRKEVYITNIVKDRPPDNRDPLPDELAVYAPFLDRQIAIIQPMIIATLGRFSMEYLLRRYNAPEAGKSISALHGTVIDVKDDDFGSLRLIPLFHPAVALYKASEKQVLFEDFKKLMAAIS